MLTVRGFFLVAQELDTTVALPQETSKGYFIQKGEDENFIIFQTLEWTQGRHIRWYEVLLEMLEEETNNWVPVNNALPETEEDTELILPENLPEFLGDGLYKTTTNNFTVALWARESGEPQSYRYIVTSYNLLGHKSSSTDYIEFEIKKAYVPEINNISQDLIYLDTLYDPAIRVTGFNLRKETDFYLLNDKEIIRPVEILIDDNDRRAEVVFDPKDFDVGEWLFRAENPGEFTSDIPMTIKFMKWYDFSLSVGYSPLFILYDESINQFFGTNFMPMGADARATFIFLKRRAGYLGVALGGKWNIVSGNFTSHSLTTHYIQGMASLVYKYPIIRNRLTVEARVGGGMIFTSGLTFQFDHSLTSTPFSSVFPAATAGVTIAGYPWRGLFIEAGADVSVAFAPAMMIISVSPTVSIGWTL